MDRGKADFAAQIEKMNYSIAKVQKVSPMTKEDPSDFDVQRHIEKNMQAANNLLKKNWEKSLHVSKDAPIMKRQEAEESRSANSSSQGGSRIAEQVNEETELHQEGDAAQRGTGHKQKTKPVVKTKERQHRPRGDLQSGLHDIPSPSKAPSTTTGNAKQIDYRTSMD